jgi:hypothetical protein
MPAQESVTTLVPFNDFAGLLVHPNLWRFEVYTQVDIKPQPKGKVSTYLCHMSPQRIIMGGYGFNVDGSTGKK